MNIDDGFRHTSSDLKQLQALPLDAKIAATKHRIQQWIDKYGVDGCYISFSGGKDSTVLFYIIREMMGYTQEQIPAVFSNTGLEFSEIQKFAKSHGATFITPKMRFNEVISTYGYPLISKDVSNAIYYARIIKNSNHDYGKTTPQAQRIPQEASLARPQLRRRRLLLGKVMMPPLNHGQTGVGGAFSSGEHFDDMNPGYEKKSLFNKEKWLPAARDLPYMITNRCCSVMKKSPLHIYERSTHRHPIMATMTDESRIRKQSWLKNGCNAFDSKDPKSQPMAFWTEQDVLEFIKKYNIEICSVYGDIIGEPGSLRCTQCQRTGCVYCGFSAHNKGDTRFLELQRIAPRQFEYAFSGGQWVDNPAYDPTAPKMDGDWQNWNPKKIWVPSKQGLGLKFVIDEFNKLYPNNQIQY